MSEVASKSITETLPYKIKDIGLAEDGRNSISISEKEMRTNFSYQYHAFADNI